MTEKDKVILKELIEIKITDSKSVAMKKKKFKENWAKIQNYKEDSNNPYNFGKITLLMLNNILSMAIFRETSGWFLKQERIKNYMVYIENQAFFSSEVEKKELRIKWRACKRWLRVLEETGRDDIPPPIELLKD